MARRLRTACYSAGHGAPHPPHTVVTGEDAEGLAAEVESRCSPEEPSGASPNGALAAAVMQPAVPRAHYTAELLCGERVLAVVDLNDGSTTVTNDAEAVVAELARVQKLESRRILYRDTDGMWDELKHDGERFVHFSAVGERDIEAAIVPLGELG